MTEVKNSKEAYEWFLRNHSGNVICVRGEEKVEVDCYPEAKKFFSIEEEECQCECHFISTKGCSCDC